MGRPADTRSATSSSPAQKLLGQLIESCDGDGAILGVALQIGPARKAALTGQSLLNLAQLRLTEVSREHRAEPVARPSAL